MMRVPAKQISEQLVSVLRAWGMSDAHAGTSTRPLLPSFFSASPRWRPGAGWCSWACSAAIAPHST